MALAVETHVDTLREQNERQKLFVGAVTHELKTPLTSLLLNVNTLRNVYLPEEKQEALLTSMDADGTKQGFDLEMTRAVVDAVHIPVIASGGCGSLEHFAEVFEKSDADAALAASLFHFGELTVPQVKEYLREQNIPVRERA